jgi:hypothetical protein
MKRDFRNESTVIWQFDSSAAENKKEQFPKSFWGCAESKISFKTVERSFSLNFGDKSKRLKIEIIFRKLSNSSH